jgi:hypothetical protein
VGALAATERPRALGPARGVQAAKLGHPGPLALGPVLADRGRPGGLRQGQDGIARALVDGHADREGALHLNDGMEEVVRAVGRVGAHQDRGVGVLADLLGDLVEGIDEHADVVGGGAGAGVSGPKKTGQGLAGQVDIGWWP